MATFYSSLQIVSLLSKDLIKFNILEEPSKKSCFEPRF